MFGAQRGPWSDEAWKGWWGANPQQAKRAVTRTPGGTW